MASAIGLRSWTIWASISRGPLVLIAASNCWWNSSAVVARVAGTPCASASLTQSSEGLSMSQHREHLFVGFAFTNPGQLDIQDSVAVVLHHDQGDIGLLPGDAPEGLGRIHPASVAFEDHSLALRARHRGAQPYWESPADGPATIREQIVVRPGTFGSLDKAPVPSWRNRSPGWRSPASA